jgi:hypothetical protein
MMPRELSPGVLSRRAVVYVRQSTGRLVRRCGRTSKANAGSTRLWTPPERMGSRTSA